MPVLNAGDAAKAPVIYIAGDSTAADNSHHPKSPQRGWGQLFSELVITPATLENRARAGRSTKSFITEKRWAGIMKTLGAGDWVIIQFGHNDQKDDPKVHAAARGDYLANLTRFIRETRERGAHPILATSVVRRKWDENGKLIDTLGEYPAVVRELAAAEKVPLIDLNQLTARMEEAAGVEGSKKFHLWRGKKDDTHYSEYGARCVAALVATEIHRLKLPLSLWVSKPKDSVRKE